MALDRWACGSNFDHSGDNRKDSPKDSPQRDNSKEDRPTAPSSVPRDEGRPGKGLHHRVQADVVGTSLSELARACVASPSSETEDKATPSPPPPPPLLVLAKHLCGNATDGALREVARAGKNVHVAAIAPCCHPQITWAEYCNPVFLREHAGLSESDFGTLLELLWASKQPLRTGELRTHPLLACFGSQERVYALGRMARRLLEEGRRRFLECLGFTCRLVEYCSAAVTPDNLLLLATRSGHPVPILPPNIPTPPPEGLLLVPVVGGSSRLASRLLRQLHHYILEIRSRSLQQA